VNTVEELRAENTVLRAKLGLNGDGAPSREALFVEIARGFLLPDDAVQSIVKYGHEDSTIRITFHIDHDVRHFECPAKKLAQVTYVRGIITDVCDRVLTYRQSHWTPIANMILSAAEKLPGYQRDTETIEWVTAFVHRVCSGHYGVTSLTPVNDGAEVFDRIMAWRNRRAGVLEATHTGELFFLRRPDGGIDFSQADFSSFVWAQQAYRLTRPELDQRLSAIRFTKALLSARKGSQVAKVKSCWHSPPGWLQDHDVDLPETVPQRGRTHVPAVSPVSPVSP
jgi:hypothetical protein